ncbi:MAG TPA: hypothetical protein VKF38_05670 [Anaerolineaceae bacterium]|nr:hypothetical protein [Anaerolineaceae bacterium]
MKPAPQSLFSVENPTALVANETSQAQIQAAQEIIPGMRLVERLIGSEIALLRASGVPVGEDEYRGLYLSETDVDRLLAVNRGSTEIETAMGATRTELFEYCQMAGGRLGQLVKMAGLQPFETACLLLCLAPELDLRFERLFAYLQDDVTKTRPRVELAQRLFVPVEQRLTAQRIFSADYAILRHHLLTLQGEPGRSYTPLLAQLLTPDQTILAYLLGEDSLDPRLTPYAEFVQYGAYPGRPPLPEVLATQARALSELQLSSLPVPAILVCGTDSLARRTLAEMLSQEWQLAMLVVDFQPLAAALGAELALALIGRQAALRQATIYLDRIDETTSPELLFTPQKFCGPSCAPLTIISVNKPFAWSGLSLELPEPGFQVRRAAWRTFLKKEADSFASTNLDGLSGKFRLTTAQIESAVQSARSRALVRNPGQHIPAWKTCTLLLAKNLPLS